MKTKMTVALAVVAVLGGCAGPTYYNPGVSQQQAQMDTAQCQMMALAGGGLPIDMASAAMSGMQRAQIQKLCFQSKGYQRVTSIEASAIKQQQVEPRPQYVAAITPVNPTYTFCADGIAREICDEND